MLTGSLVAIITPMHEDGSLDLDRRQCDLRLRFLHRAARASQQAVMPRAIP